MLLRTALPHLRSLGHRNVFFTRSFLPGSASAINSRSHYTYETPGEYEATSVLENVWKNRDFSRRGFTVGIGGPVGSGKTALTLKLLQKWQQIPGLNKTLNLGVVTNDIFTQEDAEFLTRHKALPKDRIAAVETGGCPHAAIREDVSSNLSALELLTTSGKPLLLCESGGDNLAANFSRELADLTLYVIDVAGGDKVPRKGGPGITQSDLLIINKIDLAEAVGSDLEVMKRDANLMRKNNKDITGPTVFCSVRHDHGVKDISDYILQMYEKATGVHIGHENHEHEHEHAG